MLRGSLVATIAISIVHYTDNTIRWDVYTGGEESFIAALDGPGGLGDLHRRRDRRVRGVPATVASRGRPGWLSLCSVGGLVDPFHFTTVSPSDFDVYQLVFIWIDFAIGGLSLLVRVWTTGSAHGMARSP